MIAYARKETHANRDSFYFLINIYSSDKIYNFYSTDNDVVVINSNKTSI